MKLAGKLVSVCLVLLVVATLIPNCYNPLSSILYGHIRSASRSLLMYSLFNSIIFSIIIVSHWPYTKEVDQGPTGHYYSNEVGEYATDYTKGSSDEESDYEEYHGSDGYEDDDDGDVDDSGGDDDVGWEDEEGYDDNLRKRVEDFIAKVTDGWKEEKLRDRSTLLNE